MKPITHAKTQTVAVKPTKPAVAPRTALGLPPALARRGNRVLRPRDAIGVYKHPRPEFARLTTAGVLARVAYGYAAIVPQHRLGDSAWRPDIAAVALGVAQADYGPDDVALMGVSAARHHGAIPRAIALATVAAPKQRPILMTEFGKLIFVKRDVSALDLEKITTELGVGWVTTVEQTLLDLADRPTLGDLGPDAMTEAIRALAARADMELVAELGTRQHKPGALKSVRQLAGIDA
jgi:hypothetical protein